MKEVHAHKSRIHGSGRRGPGTDATSASGTLDRSRSRSSNVEKSEKDPKTVVLQGLAETTGALESAIEALKHISAIIAFQAAWQQPKQPPVAPYIR